ncbi:restriction endonuclease subunit S [Muriicola marianensis]|uniref:Type I restriction endonuclease subunit S n=1 Tax=Muriicola marianensis TaxID=1324801 RepID=A0ABQ1QWZ7_9FLAO|nr:restriction endonuclease subunit S [Muriicola marianensis]GGD50480.1 type I restriction endonuclease subunit S [Muriicola marianensis]
MSEWKEFQLEDFAYINPTERIRKGVIAKKIPMEFIHPFTKRIPAYSLEEYRGGVKFRNGDTLMARITPSLENGKTSFVDILDEDEIGFGSTEFIVLREKEVVSDKHFLYYLAISPTIRSTAIKSMTGSSGRQRVQTDVLRAHVFEAPELDEQKAIASILSSLDDKIDLLHRQNHTLEQMAETLFRQWFVEESDGDWEEGTITDYAEHSKVSIKPSANPSAVYAHYSIPGFDSGKEPAYELGQEIKSNKYQVFANTILFSKLNPHKDKRVWLILDEVPQNAICSTEFQVIKPYHENHLYFIYGWLSNSNNYREISSGVGGTSGSHQRISPNEIFLFPTPKISNEPLHDYAKSVKPLFLKQQMNQTQIRNLTALRDTLLPKLMSGEVQVRNTY